MVDSMITAQSEFLPKVDAHEDDHLDWEANPSRCGFKYFNKDDARAFLESCARNPSCGSGASLAEALARVGTAWNDWLRSELALRNLFRPNAEAEAYEISNRVAPYYIWQTIDKVEACPK